MTFNDLIDITPKVRLCDIIQLWLKSYDDKIYVNVYEGNKCIAEDVRIISEKLIPYYERVIEFMTEDKDIFIYNKKISTKIMRCEKC